MHSGAERRQGDGVLEGNDAWFCARSLQSGACLEHTDILNGALACGPPGGEPGEGVGQQSPNSGL